MQLNFKNVWGSAQSNVDPQRQDLFLIDLVIPPVLNTGAGAPGGANLWQSTCQFAVQAFPFSARERTMIEIKYLQQTNYVIGGDVALPPTTVPVRWAFQQQTAEMLERWYQLMANSQTGGVAITSQVKSYGYFYWLVPNMAVQSNVDNTDGTNVMLKGPKYYLEGALVKDVKPSNADMTTNGLVTLDFVLQFDRYYSLDPSDLTFAVAPATALQTGISSYGLTV